MQDLRMVCKWSFAKLRKNVTYECASWNATWEIGEVEGQLDTTYEYCEFYGFLHTTMKSYKKTLKLFPARIMQSNLLMFGCVNVQIVCPMSLNFKCDHSLSLYHIYYIDKDTK